MQIKALPGFRDFYPEEMALRNRIVDVWKSVAHSYGFDEYDGPPLEALELYTAKSGDEIVKQLYAFTDRGGREVALRPEMTPTLARMVATRAKALRKPIRWFSVPQLFRYERQQRGRLREHLQLNMDLIGEPGPLGDAEIMAAAIDVVRQLGFDATEFQCRVSDRRLIAVVLSKLYGLDEVALPVAFQALDKVGRSQTDAIKLVEQSLPGDDAARRRATALLEAVNDPDGAVELQARAWELEDAAHLRATVEALGHMGFADFVTVDLRIVRGLAYYTGPVFELFDLTLGLRAICGGGRYDNLLHTLGGIDLPALGFGMGDVVLTEMLRARADLEIHGDQLRAFVVAVTPDDVPCALGVVRQLRDRGHAVEYALHPSPVRRQLELGGVRGARYALIVGPEERNDGVAVLRNFQTKEERRVPLTELADAIAS